MLKRQLLAASLAVGSSLGIFACSPAAQALLFHIPETSDRNEQAANKTYSINSGDTYQFSGSVAGNDTGDLIRFVPGPGTSTINLEFPSTANTLLHIVSDINNNHRIDVSDQTILIYRHRLSSVAVITQTIQTSPGKSYLAKLTRRTGTPGSTYVLMLGGR
jgi:hypothetical protein